MSRTRCQPWAYTRTTGSFPPRDTPSCLETTLSWGWSQKSSEISAQPQNHVHKMLLWLATVSAFLATWRDNTWRRTTQKVYQIGVYVNEWVDLFNLVYFSLLSSLCTGILVLHGIRAFFILVYLMQQGILGNDSFNLPLCETREDIARMNDRLGDILK